MIRMSGYIFHMTLRNEIISSAYIVIGIEYVYIFKVITKDMNPPRLRLSADTKKLRLNS